MTLCIPQNQSPILLDWNGKGGGIRVYAYTDEKGMPIYSITGFDELFRATTITKQVEGCVEYDDTIKQIYAGNIYQVPYHLKATYQDVGLFVTPPPEIDLSPKDDWCNTICTAWGTPLVKPDLHHDYALMAHIAPATPYMAKPALGLSL